MRRQDGFTLIEIAIVLVIIGLLLAVCSKARNSSPVPCAQHDLNAGRVKAAYFGFLDRYRALPGDYSAAIANIPGCGACTNGNNKGKSVRSPQAMRWTSTITSGSTSPSGVYYRQLCLFRRRGDSRKYPTNPYGAFTQLILTVSIRCCAHQQAQPENRKQRSIDILAEVDRKIDDGLGNAGQFRFSTFGGAVNTAREFVL